MISPEECLKIAKTCYESRDLLGIPTTMFTRELALIAVGRLEYALAFVPIEVKDFDVCLAAVKFHKPSVKYVNKELAKVEMIYEYVLENDGTAIRYIPQTMVRIQHSLWDKDAIRYIIHPTPELYALAVFNNPAALAHVPKEYQTLGMCARAMMEDSENTMKHIKMRNTCDLETLLSINGLLLEQLEPEYISFNLCNAAIKQCASAVAYVPSKSSLSKEQREILFEIAIKIDPWVLQYVRDQCPKLCLLAVRLDGRALQFVQLQTEDICNAAVAQCAEAAKMIRPGVILPLVCPVPVAAPKIESAPEERALALAPALALASVSANSNFPQVTYGGRSGYFIPHFSENDSN